MKHILTVLLVVGVVASVAAWLWPRSSPRPVIDCVVQQDASGAHITNPDGSLSVLCTQPMAPCVRFFPKGAEGSPCDPENPPPWADGTQKKEGSSVPAAGPGEANG